MKVRLGVRVQRERLRGETSITAWPLIGAMWGLEYVTEVRNVAGRIDVHAQLAKSSGMPLESL